MLQLPAAVLKRYQYRAMSVNMKAAVLHEVVGPFSIEEVELLLHFAINSGFQTANVSSFCVSRVNFRGSDHMACSDNNSFRMISLRNAFRRLA